MKKLNFINHQYKVHIQQTSSKKVPNYHCLFEVNGIYNTHFTGAPLWNLFGKEADMFEKTWNVSVKNMFQISVKTHKYLIEPISNSPHLKSILIKRFLSFIEKIESGRKNTVKHILRVNSLDCRSTTGNNLRNILLLTNKSRIEQLTPRDANQIRYHPINTDDEWKINCILEIIETLNSKMDIQCFEECELKDMLDFLCTC